MKYLEKVLVVVLGAGLIFFGYQTQIVGHSNMHFFLLTMGVLAILGGVL